MIHVRNDPIIKTDEEYHEALQLNRYNRDRVRLWEAAPDLLPEAYIYGYGNVFILSEMVTRMNLALEAYAWNSFATADKKYEEAEQELQKAKDRAHELWRMAFEADRNIGECERAVTRAWRTAHDRYEKTPWSARVPGGEEGK